MFCRFSLGKPFEKDEGWAVWALLGVVLAPAVVGTAAAILSAVGYESLGAAQVNSCG